MGIVAVGEFQDAVDAAVMRNSMKTVLRNKSEKMCMGQKIRWPNSFK